jgi:hypothetical protein
MNLHASSTLSLLAAIQHRKTMNENQTNLELLDQQAEADRDRDYVHQTRINFDFDEHRCDHRFASHLPVIARLIERLSGPDAPLHIDLTQQPAPQRKTWAIVDAAGRGLILHHDHQIHEKTKDYDEFLDIYWSSVGLPSAFAICELFGRYLLEGAYDVNLTPFVEIYSNLPEALHQAAVQEFEEAMLGLGFHRQRPLPSRTYSKR